MTYFAALSEVLQLFTLAYLPIMNFAALLALIVIALIDFAAMMKPCDDPECDCHLRGLA